MLDGSPLRAADIAGLAGGAAVAVDDAALARVAASQAAAERAASERPVYGRSTGVGANRDVEVTDPDEHALRLLRSHATAAGPAREPARVRATVVVRLNQLLAGGSGVRPEIVVALADLLGRGALPELAEWGGIGTGDLAALARVALALRADGV